MTTPQPTHRQAVAIARDYDELSTARDIADKYRSLYLAAFRTIQAMQGELELYRTYHAAQVKEPNQVEAVPSCATPEGGNK